MAYFTPAKHLKANKLQLAMRTMATSYKQLTSGEEGV